MKKVLIYILLSTSFILTSCNGGNTEKNTGIEEKPKLKVEEKEVKSVDQIIIELSADEVGEKMVLLKTLETQWKELYSAEERLQFYMLNKDDLNSFGGVIRSVQDVDKLLVTGIEHIKEAIIERAKANAAKKQASELYKKAYILREMAKLKGDN